MKKTYIIAEIGINHNGDLNIAKKLIDIAQMAGCDSVKFQKRNPDICVPEHQKSVMRDTPWGRMSYIDYKHKVEFGFDEYDEIDRYCEDRGIGWSASPWDMDSLEFLNQFDLPYIKIPSAMLTNKELVIGARNTGKKVIASTGMSTFEEIDTANGWLINGGEILKKMGSGNKNYALLHCNSQYPAPLEELNLSAIKTLKDRFFCEVGYSGHEFRLGTSVAAVYLGATIIERHITLDRTMWGTDQLCSIEPQGLIKLVKGIRELEICYGDGQLGCSPGELEMAKKLRG
jgi:N-acetylneuraminate synthase